MTWAIIPGVITIGGFVWALWPRDDERPTGSMFDGMGQVLGLAMRIPTAASISLAAWLIWVVLS